MNDLKRFNKTDLQNCNENLFNGDGIFDLTFVAQNSIAFSDKT